MMLVWLLSAGGWGVPIHDHVDWLGVDFVGNDFGVFAEKVKDCIRGRVPGDLSVNLVTRWGVRGRSTFVILTTAQSMRLASLLRSWKGIVSFASSMTVVSPIPGVNCVPRRGRDCGVYISGNRNVAMLLTIYHLNTIRRWGIYLSADDTMAGTEWVNATRHTFRTKTTISTRTILVWGTIRMRTRFKCKRSLVVTLQTPLFKLLLPHRRKHHLPPSKRKRLVHNILFIILKPRFKRSHWHRTWRFHNDILCMKESRPKWHWTNNIPMRFM